jgi:hypothetical protein
MCYLKFKIIIINEKLLNLLKQYPCLKFELWKYRDLKPESCLLYHLI